MHVPAIALHAIQMNSCKNDSVILQADHSGSSGGAGVSVHLSVVVAFALEDGTVSWTRSVLFSVKVKDDKLLFASPGVVKVSVVLGNTLASIQI